jgi:YfiH family protein
MEYRIHEREGVRWFSSPLLETAAGPAHAFGALREPGAAPPTAEDLLRALGSEMTMPLPLEQVHGAEVHRADSDDGFPREGDGTVTDRAVLAPTVRTADCVPVLVRSPGTRAVAALHAGWRGLLAGVVESGIERLRAEYGAEPGDLLVGVGPGIGACCYEVGEEVASRFDADLLRPGFTDTPHLDLWEATRRRLEKAGVPRERISMARLCTSCHPEWFPSFRRDGEGEARVSSLIVPTL